MDTWEHIGEISPRHLVEARLEIHHASQLIAVAFARALLPPRDDDSHSALTWHDVPGLWVTGQVPGSGGVRAGLRPAGLVLTLGGKDDPAGSQLELQGMSLTDSLDWLRHQLTELGLEGDKATLDAPYELPAHPVATGAKLSVQQEPARVELARYFGAAAMLLADVAREHKGASPILTWPHHFDIATLLPAGNDVEGNQRSIGVGMSPGDDNYAEPYLYVSPWPFPTAAKLPELPHGRWHHKGFHAAVLTATELLDGDPESIVRGFVDAAIAAGRELFEA